VIDEVWKAGLSAEPWRRRLFAWWRR